MQTPLTAGTGRACACPASSTSAGTTAALAAAAVGAATTAAAPGAGSMLFADALAQRLEAAATVSNGAPANVIEIADVLDDRFDRLDADQNGSIALGSEVHGAFQLLREADRGGNGYGSTTVAELRSYLNSFDANHDGALGIRERTRLRRALNQPHAGAVAIQALAERRLDRLDDNHDGRIELGVETRGPHTMLKAADADGDGVTTMQELTSYLNSFDENDDGKLSFRERARMLFSARHPVAGNPAAATDPAPAPGHT